MKDDLSIAVPATDAELVAKHIGRALGVEFQGHDSGYKGSYWRYVDADDSSVEISYNRDPMFRVGDAPEEMYFEFEFKEFAVLLRAYATSALRAHVFAAVQSCYPNSVVISGNAAQLGIQADAASPRRLT